MTDQLNNNSTSPAAIEWNASNKTPPSWTDLRIFGKSKFVSLTIVVPFLGYILLLNDEVLHLFSLKQATGEGDLDVLARLYFIYMGLTILGIFSLIFSLTCPRVIKDFDSFYSFAEKEKQHISTGRLRQMLNSFHESDTLETNTLMAHLKSCLSNYSGAHLYGQNSANDAIRIAGTKRIQEENSNELLDAFWHYSNGKLFPLRCIIATGYATGSFLVLYPSFLVFKRVLALALN